VELKSFNKDPYYVSGKGSRGVSFNLVRVEDIFDFLEIFFFTFQNFCGCIMLLGCVYIPPENSKYSSEEAFIEIEDEL
jgi:hypothetical protein